jgi:hypothetical protein
LKLKKYHKIWEIIKFATSQILPFVLKSDERQDRRINSEKTEFFPAWLRKLFTKEGLYGRLRVYGGA